MAILTTGLAVLTDEGLMAEVELDYDDVALTLVTVRCINSTAREVVVTGTAHATGRSFTRLFAASETGEQPLPQNAAAKFDIMIDERGRLDGVDYSCGWALP